MRPGEARSIHRAHKIEGTDRAEEQVRRLAASALRWHPNGGDVNLPWSDGTRYIPVDEPSTTIHVRVIRVQVPPGKDFAAQLVVEQQIREQVA